MRPARIVVVLILGIGALANLAPAAGQPEAPTAAGLQRSEQLLEQGFAAARNREIEKARNLFREALLSAERVLGGGHPGLEPMIQALARADMALREKKPELADPRYWQMLRLQKEAAAAAATFALSKAATLYEQALPLALALFAQDATEVRMLMDELGGVHRTLGEHARALVHYRRLLESYERSHGPDSAQVANSIVEVAEEHLALGEHAKALALFERAVESVKKEVGSGHRYVDIWRLHVARAYKAMGRYGEALELFRRGLAAQEQEVGPEDASLARPLSDLGRLYTAMAQYPAALRVFERQLAVSEKAHGADSPQAAGALLNLAGVYGATGDYARALPLRRRGIAIEEKSLGTEHPEVAASLSNLAGLYKSMGDLAKALPLYRRSLAITENVYGTKHPRVATIASNLAGLLAEMGDYAAALALYERSLAIQQETLGSEHPSVATTLNGLGLLYEDLGDHARALQHLERGLAISEKAFGTEHPRVATSLNNLAGLHMDLGQHTTAMALYERNLSITRKTLGPDHPDLATGLNNIAVAYNSMGDYAKALSVLQESLAIRESLGADHPGRAITLNNLGFAYQNVGRHARAVGLHQRALRIAKTAGVPESARVAQSGLREALAQQGQPELAIFFGKQAVNTVQGMRSRLVALDASLQRSFLRDKESIYRGLADLLIEQGRLPEAHQVMAMLKEEEFFDFIRRDAKSDPRGTQAALSVQEERWQKRYQEVSDRLAILGTEWETLRKKAPLGLSEAEQKRRTEVQADLRSARLAFEQFLGSLMREAERAGPARAREVGERGLSTLRALQGTLGRLGEGVVALHYVLGEERLSILLTTSSVQIGRAVQVRAAEVNRKIEQFRRALQSPGSDPQPLAGELYGLLVAPVARDLEQAGARTLMLSLDGALRYLPFAALHDGKRYLIEDYRFAIFTEAAKDKLKDVPQGAWRVAGLGLTREVEGFSPLPGVRRELEGIVGQGGGGVLPGELHLDEDFTVQRLRDALDQAYPVLHVASHFVFRPGTEASSFLLLGDGSRLTLREVKETDLDFRNVDLITLSACETAVGGGRDANGAEIEGFGALAQQQGARAVIATLWPVADESTGLLMRSFYRVRQANRGMTKAEALRQVQSEFARGELRAGEARRYAHPFYWAPFILMGNWL